MTTFNSTNSNCYVPINLPVIDAFIQGFQWPSIENPLERKLLYFNNLRHIFSTKWLDMMASHKINLNTAMMFYKPANHIPTEAHVDIVKQDLNGSVVCALNWTIGGSGSVMKWYDTKSKNSKEVFHSATGTPSAIYKFENLLEICKTDISNKLTLVRTNIPHAIWCGNEPRWCISVRLPYGQLKSWEEAKDFFSNVCYN